MDLQSIYAWPVHSLCPLSCISQWCEQYVPFTAAGLPQNSISPDP